TSSILHPPGRLIRLRQRSPISPGRVNPPSALTSPENSLYATGAVRPFGTAVNTVSGCPPCSGVSRPRNSTRPSTRAPGPKDSITSLRGPSVTSIFVMAVSCDTPERNVAIIVTGPGANAGPLTATPSAPVGDERISSLRRNHTLAPLSG